MGRGKTRTRWHSTHYEGRKRNAPHNRTPRGSSKVKNVKSGVLSGSEGIMVGNVEPGMQRGSKNRLGLRKKGR